jgi:predicted ribosomally synthesized peptide with SipW-like signal peptide
MVSLAKIYRNNKRTFSAVCILLFAVGLLVSGTSLAYFTSHDEVTNVHKATDIRIDLLETEWNLSGNAEAHKMRPGITIAKDPAAVNRSENSVYVRMKFTITDNDGKELTGDQKNAILGNIYTGTGTDEKTLLDKDGKCQNENFVLSDDGWYYYKTADGYTELKSGDVTPTLFDSVHVPVTKTKYAYFANGFKIDVTVQAIAAATPDSDVVASFEKAYAE